jgi:predicted metal-dependent peptidase
MMMMPYFSGALAQLRVKFVQDGETEVSTMAVTPKWSLLVNTTFLMATEEILLAGVILHEVNHLLRRHSERGSGPQWNEAADLEINDDLGHDLPEGALYPSRYGFEDHLLAEEYLDLLRQKEQQQQQQQQQQGDDEDDDQEAGGGGDGDDQDDGDSPGAGGDEGQSGQQQCGCGGGAGHPVDEKAEQQADHANGASEAEIDHTEREVAKKVQEHVKKFGQGAVSADLREWADQRLMPPQIRWQTHLRRAVHVGTRVRPGHAQDSYSIKGRRSDLYSKAVGLRGAFFAGRVTPKPTVAVAIDTSGSMGDTEVNRAISEIGAILKRTRADVRVMSADAQICKSGMVSNVRQIRDLIGGGGGTDFRPVFDWLQGEGRGTGMLVYVTDGWGSFPKTAPRDTHVVWVMVGGRTNTPPWGTVVEVTE